LQQSEAELAAEHRKTEAVGEREARAEVLPRIFSWPLLFAGFILLFECNQAALQRKNIDIICGILIVIGM
jgi:hypothetical protein